MPYGLGDRLETQQVTNDKIPVIITTSHRGVFFGWIDPAKRYDSVIDMTGARNCLHWHESIGGFLGLAGRGPNNKCRVGAQVDGTFTVRDVTSVADCGPEAVAAWEAA